MKRIVLSLLVIVAIVGGALVLISASTPQAQAQDGCQPKCAREFQEAMAKCIELGDRGCIADAAETLVSCLSKCRAD
jgi:hypothetical protein